MKFWLSETASVGIEWLCIVTGHWRGCWILNRSPLTRLYFWAADVFYRQQDYAGRHDCPYCGKGRPRPSDGGEWDVRTADGLPQTGNSGVPFNAVTITRRETEERTP